MVQRVVGLMSSKVKRSNRDHNMRGEVVRVRDESIREFQVQMVHELNSSRGKE